MWEKPNQCCICKRQTKTQIGFVRRDDKWYCLGCYASKYISEETLNEAGIETSPTPVDPLTKGKSILSEYGGTISAKKWITKDTNPKEGVGVKKWRQYSATPTTVIWGLGAAMLEGARKYGRHNYRVDGVRASVYVDAAKGHIDQFWEGEDIDRDSQLHHILKAMGSLAVLYDAIANDFWVDDRPPKIDLDKIRREMQTAVDHMFEKYPDGKPSYTQVGLDEKKQDG